MFLIQLSVHLYIFFLGVLGLLINQHYIYIIIIYTILLLSICILFLLISPLLLTTLNKIYISTISVILQALNFLIGFDNWLHL